VQDTKPPPIPPTRRVLPRGNANIVAGCLGILGLAAHVVLVLISRDPWYHYTGPLSTKVTVELTIYLLLIIGGWKLVHSGDGRMMSGGAASGLGYAFTAWLRAWDHTPAWQLQWENVREILRGTPAGEWRNLMVVYNLESLLTNLVMLLWCLITLRSCLFEGRMPDVVPRVKEPSNWRIAVIALLLGMAGSILPYIVGSLIGQRLGSYDLW